MKTTMLETFIRKMQNAVDVNDKPWNSLQCKVQLVPPPPFPPSIVRGHCAVGPFFHPFSCLLLLSNLIYILHWQKYHLSYIALEEIIIIYQYCTGGKTRQYIALEEKFMFPLYFLRWRKPMFLMTKFYWRKTMFLIT